MILLSPLQSFVFLFIANTTTTTTTTAATSTSSSTSSTTESNNESLQFGCGLGDIVCSVLAHAHSPISFL